MINTLTRERKENCMRKIRRTFNLSKCTGSKFNYETEEFEDFYIELTGNYTPKRATNKVRKMLKDNSIQIFNVEIESEMWAISPEDFLKYGERIK